MIPNKLYLPTSSLNFNNIMSSESISPLSFFIHRKFGYDRFYKVEANSLDNYLLLYEKYPVFHVDDSKLENYPIVFEIDMRNVNVEIQEYQGVYLTHQTIYLNPFDTRIIFRNIEELQNAISKAFPMIDTKLIPLYQGQFVVLTDDIETFYWNPINIDDLPNYDNNAVSFDIILNKLKGMIYGYLLGTNESSSKEVISLKRMVKELRNVLSAILASPDGQSTHFQQKQLDELYTNINHVFYTLGGIESKIDKVISQKIDNYKTPNFVEILKGEGLYLEWYRKQVSQLNLRCYEITPFPLSYQAINKVLELDKYIDDIEQKIHFYDIKTKLDITKLPIIQNRHIVEVPEQKDFLSMLLNEYVDEVWNGTEFLSSRYEFATVGGKLCREKSGERWENSPEKSYINSLRRNLNEYTSFDISSIDSNILRSFAAFCQKGESDIDKLRDYLISNGIEDFSIAFALWGLIFGFAEMPKTLTDDFYNNTDRKYVSDVYKYIYKQIHGIDLEGELKIKETANNENKQGPSVNRRSTGTITISSKINDMQEDVSSNPISLLENKTQEVGERIIKPMPEILKKIQDTPEFKNMSAKAQEYYTKEALEIYEGKEDKTFLDKLEKLSYEKTSTQWKKIVKSLKPKRQRKMTRNNISQTSIFSESTGELLKDLDFLLNNKEFISLVYEIKGWEKDIKWFIEVHNPTHEDYYKYYGGKPMDNGSVIKRFVSLKKGRYKNTESFLRKTYLK